MQSRNGHNSSLCKKIDNYVFKFSDVLGQGNFSKVYKGTHQLTKQTVAIKVIQLNSLKSTKLEELLFSEIDVLKKLNHPNILKCYEVFSSDRNCYIITEMCNGGDLQTKLRLNKHFSQSEAQPYILDVFKGLKYLAENHVTHRDLKVANVFLHNGKAKIADFGFAKFTKENFKDINIGSPIYMSPEGILQNIYGPKTDVWAFGIFIYELLHGKTPYSHCKSEIDLKRQIQIPLQYTSMKSQISFDLKQTIFKCMETKEERRLTISELQQTSYFRKLLKKDKEMGSYGEPIRKILPNSLQKKDLKPEKIEHYSQQKNRYNIKNYQNDQGEFKQKNGSSSSQSYGLVYPLKRSNQKQITSQFSGSSNRPMSEEKNFILKQFKQKIEMNPGHRNNYYGSPSKMRAPLKIQPTLPTKSSINPSNSAIKPLKKSGMMGIFPGIVNFKESVNALHYCRLLYKFLVLAKETDSSKDKDLAKILAAWMFKILSQITQKIERKEVVYDEQTTSKQTKLKDVTNQYLSKYSSAIERPFDVQTNFDLIIAETTTKIQQYDSKQIYRPEAVDYLHLASFLVIILESTKLLKHCSEQLRFWEWSENKSIQEFLALTKSSLTYHKYLEARRRVLK